MTTPDTHSHEPESPPPLVFLDIEETARRVSLSRRTIYRMFAENLFPQPVPISPRRIGFIESEIVAWQMSRINVRVR